MPSGNEIGADKLLWIPGGRTLGGLSETIIEPIKVKKNTNIYTTKKSLSNENRRRNNQITEPHKVF